MKNKMNKKAYFFSLDALLALIIILGVVLVVKPSTTHVTQEMNLQEDFLSTLSSLKISEIDNDYVRSLIADGSITNLNQSVLEQIGEFYANSDEKAELLTENILNDLNLKENIGLYFNNIEIAHSGNLDFNDAEDVWTARQIISGVQQGKGITGYAARAFLFSENKMDYFYFGGYVGDGNITVNLGEDVSSVKVEAVFSSNFEVSVNGLPAETHAPTSGIPYEFSISSGFVSGNNYLYFTSDENLYIAGGFIKIIYNDEKPLQTINKYNFPGIGGLINIYSSFYVPGGLQSMEVFLNYSSLYNVFMTIGNERVYSGNGSNVHVTLSNSTLAGILDYSELNDKTIPYRLGLENVSYILNASEADVFSVTDLSGSMRASCFNPDLWCCLIRFGGTCGDSAKCRACGGTWQDKMQSAKDANNVFIDVVLNYSGNRVGLVGYKSSVHENSYHPLSDDIVSLHAKVNSWNAGGGTCICCGINRATNELVTYSIPEKFRSMVVMSDGEANRECSEQGTGDAKEDAIQASCEAYDNHNITVYAVGFGIEADETTLQAIASCGHGNYYYGDIDELAEIYEQIAHDIINATYYEQTIFGEGVETILYPNSYISVDYEKTIPYGMIITTETETFGVSAPIGNFSLPFDAIPYEVKVVSYSGTKWTSKVDVYDNVSGWESVFDLSDYNSPYIELGDPYLINIPLNKVRAGENLVNVSLGLSPNNLTAGSEHNKVIYSVVKNISSYSKILSSANGCTWTIEFEDGTNSTMKIPSSYNGTEECSYTSGSVAFNNNDAIDYAIFNLLSILDLNSNRKVETKFTENDLTIDTTSIEDIPFTWETEAQTRVWR